MTDIFTHRVHRFLLCVACFLLAQFSLANAQSGRSGERTPSSAAEEVLAFTFSPDGRMLAIARGITDFTKQSGRIDLFDTGTGKLLHTIKGFDGPVWSVSFSPDGETLVSASTEIHDRKLQEKPGQLDSNIFGELKWWNGKTGEFKQKIRISENDRVRIAAAYSPDGKTLATMEFALQYGLSTGSENSIDPQLTGQLPARNRLNQRLLYSEVDLKLLDSQTGALKNKLQSLSQIQFPFNPISFGSGPRSLGISLGRAEHIVFGQFAPVLAQWEPSESKFWDENGRTIRKIKFSKGFLSAVALSPDGKVAACAVVFSSGR